MKRSNMTQTVLPFPLLFDQHMLATLEWQNGFSASFTIFGKQCYCHVIFLISMASIQVSSSKKSCIDKRHSIFLEPIKFHTITKTKQIIFRRSCIAHMCYERPSRTPLICTRTTSFGPQGGSSRALLALRPHEWPSRVVEQSSREKLK